MPYAERTTVSAEKSRGEIERTLTRYGADGFMYGWQDTRAMVEFLADGRRIRFELPMPDRAELAKTKTGQRRSRGAIDSAYDNAVRQRWRALLLVIKAKLEAVEAGIVTFESEFLAHIVLPNDQTVAQQALPAIAQAYDSGETPRLLTYDG